MWCLGPINQRYIPQAVIQAEIALERKVSHAACTGHYHELHDACTQALFFALLSLAHSDTFRSKQLCRSFLKRLWARMAVAKPECRAPAATAGEAGACEVGGALGAGGLWAFGVCRSSQLGARGSREVQPGDSPGSCVCGPIAVPAAAQAHSAPARRSGTGWKLHPLAISMHCMQVLWQLIDMILQPQDERVNTLSRCQAPGSWVVNGRTRRHQTHTDVPSLFPWWTLQVSLVQAENFAWFGYPDDPEPSARNFLPGLAKVRLPDLSLLS